MKPETFFDNFEVLADAPNGVQKLREMILQLAVRGKLVAQDERDEPAEVLLKNIKANQKKTSYNPVEEEEEMPYDLPKKWEWVRLGEILALEYGDSLPSSKRSENGKYPVYGSNGIVGYHDKFLIDKPSIIVGRKGSCGALNICLEPSWPTDVSYFIIPPVEIDLKFAYILLKSLNLEKLGKGIKPGLNRNEAYLLVTSLPPFNEQRRIVAKVDQLMSLCDELEARQQKKRESRTHLNSAALDRLLAARAPGEFTQGWRRISDNFDVLYDAPENVSALRRAILQLAVMGKLVEQYPTDETASELLKKIKIKKIKLVNTNKIQNDKKPSKLSIEKNPWEIPSNWIWATLQDAFEISRGGSPRPSGDPKYFGGNIPWITVGEITKDNSKFLESTEDGLTEDGKERSRVIKPNDLLLTNSGATLGVPKISKIEGCINDGVALLRQFHSYDLNDYAYLFLLSQTESFRKVKQGMGQPNLNTSIIADWYFPLPPIAEQRRIVARVDPLMSLCDKLEAGLMRSQADIEGAKEAEVRIVIAHRKPVKFASERDSRKLLKLQKYHRRKRLF